MEFDHENFVFFVFSRQGTAIYSFLKGYAGMPTPFPSSLQHNANYMMPGFRVVSILYPYFLYLILPNPVIHNPKLPNYPLTRLSSLLLVSSIIRETLNG
jgi:hypothetical protein